VIGKLLGHRVAATTSRYAHLARDAVAVAAVNDELGAAMTAAIEKGAPPRNWPRSRRRSRRERRQGQKFAGLVLNGKDLISR